jgi:hypothetical protein
MQNRLESDGFTYSGDTGRYEVILREYFGDISSSNSTKGLTES